MAGNYASGLVAPPGGGRGHRQRRLPRELAREQQSRAPPAPGRRRWQRASRPRCPTPGSPQTQASDSPQPLLLQQAAGPQTPLPLTRLRKQSFAAAYHAARPGEAGLTRGRGGRGLSGRHTREATPLRGPRPPARAAPRALSRCFQPQDLGSDSSLLPTFILYKLLDSGGLAVLQFSTYYSWCRPYCCKSPNPRLGISAMLV